MPTCSRPDSVLEVTSATWIESCRKTSACLCRIYVKSKKSMCRRPLTSSTRLLYVWMWSSAIQTPTPFWTSSVPLRGSFLWVLQEAYFYVLHACGLLWRTCVKKKDNSFINNYINYVRKFETMMAKYDDPLYKQPTFTYKDSYMFSLIQAHLKYAMWGKVVL